MSRTPRSEIFDADEIGIYHCINRCVRQLHLLRDDQPGGKEGSPRRAWIRARLEELAGIFAFDHLNFSIMDNHLHLLIRNRPDVRDGWADEEVVRRWWQLCPGRRDDDGRPAMMSDDEVQRCLADQDQVLVLRRRLGDISWFMKSLNEYISVRANAEDQTKGCFWEGRFKSIRILDDCGLLACAAYIDLNPVRARLAETPETSRFTSVYERLSALQASLAEVTCTQPSDTMQISAHASVVEAAAAAHDSLAGWLSPVQLDGASESQMPAPSRRASNTGYLDLSFVEYLSLLDWTGRSVRDDKPGSIPEHLATIFDRLQIQGEVWIELIRNFTAWFPTAVGRIESVRREAQRRGRKFIRGTSYARAAFAG